MLITGAYGLGENVVQGTVDPDEFHVFKPTFREGHRAVLRRRLGAKEVRMVYSTAAGRETTRNVPTPKEDQSRYCIGDDDVLDWRARPSRSRTTKPQGRQAHADGHRKAKGRRGRRLYIVQARP